MPRHGPDPSQRPRREAPGMLTGLAILERELGRIEYERHGLELRRNARLTRAQARQVESELEELDRLRLQTLQLLDQWHQDYEDRKGLHAA